MSKAKKERMWFFLTPEKKEKISQLAEECGIARGAMISYAVSRFIYDEEIRREAIKND